MMLGLIPDVIEKRSEGIIFHLLAEQPVWERYHAPIGIEEGKDKSMWTWPATPHNLDMRAFSRPFGTDAIVKSRDPTLKGWAILESSLRDEKEIPGALRISVTSTARSSI